MGNLISAISALGAFLGGLTILIYLIGEDYFPPEINASSIGMLLAAAALVGILLTISISLYLVLAGYIYRHILVDGPKEGSNKLLSDRAIYFLLDIPAIAVSAILFLCLIIDTKSTLSFFLWILISLVLTLVVFALALEQSRRNNTDGKNKLKWWKVCAIVVVSAVLAAAPWIFILLFAVGYSLDGADDFHVWVAIAGMSVAVVVANHVIARVGKLWVLFLVPFAVLLFVFLFTRQIDLIPRMVVHALTIGDIRNATLQLDEEGCQVVSQYASVISDETNNTCSSEVVSGKSIACTLSSTTIAWRIGNEYLVDATVVTDQKNKTSSELAFKVVGLDKAVEHAEVTSANAPGKPISTAVKQAKGESVFHRYKLKLNSKFTLSSTHVLSWSAKKVSADAATK
jgi:hypothetical protein